MREVFLIREERTEHAKAVRRATGTNDFRDKRISFQQAVIMPCISTILCKDNLLLKTYYYPSGTILGFRIKNLQKK